MTQTLRAIVRTDCVSEFFISPHPRTQRVEKLDQESALSLSLSWIANSDQTVKKLSGVDQK